VVFILLFGTLSVTTGCTPTEVLPLRLDLATTEEWSARWVKAPIILVGVVETARDEGVVWFDEKDLSLSVRLHELAIKVESVIRGSPAAEKITVYRYGFSGGHLPGYVPVSDLLPGERRVLCLIEADNRYRMFEDVVASSFVVASGHHSSTSRGKRVTEQIAEVLVLPGEGFENSEYAKTLEVQATSAVYALVGFRRTVLLLGAVQGRGLRVVSAQACLSLYVLHPFGHRCIESVRDDPKITESMQVKARETLSTYSSVKHEALTKFIRRPAEWVRGWVEHTKLMSYASAEVADEDARFLLNELAVGTHGAEAQRKAAMLLREYDNSDK
jgi:hypothetical protein